MPTTIVSGYKALRTTRQYDDLLKSLSTGVKRRVEEVIVPSVKVISVTGNEPPTSLQFQHAIAVLYGIAYGLKMGMKFRKLARPRGWFDYRVGALETFWWTTGKVLDIKDAKTLRWQAHLMVPAFVTRKLFEEARSQAKAKHPDIPYDRAIFTTVREGRSVQVMHVGPWDQEQPAIDALHEYMTEHALWLNGRHHEIYISDPRRVKPEKLRTVIRLAVKRRPRKSAG
jgi:hypothetical protein